MLKIQEALEKKYPRLFSDARMFRQPMLALLKLVTHEKGLQKFEERYPGVTGLDFVTHILEFFNFSFAVRQNEKERILSSGRLMIVANQPIGSLDAMALLKMVSEIRKDVKIVANSALTSVSSLESLTLSLSGKKSPSWQSELKAIKSHLDREGVVIMFPAGDVSRIGFSGIKDDRWRTQFLSIAEEAHAPILPVYINARNSLFFYSLSLVSRPLSKLWLVRESFKHSENSVVIRIGELVAANDYADLNLPLKTKAKLFRKQVYRLPNDKPSLFRTQSSIAHPENRQLLNNEIRQCERLGETRDGKHIYLYRYYPDSAIMREIGRLREEAFRLIGEGTGQRRDIDSYDQHYLHIVLWDESDLEIVGAYRLCPTRAALNSEGRAHLYTATLFDYMAKTEDLLNAGLELGRSFVQPRYWGTRSLDYLWFGISAYLQQNPQYRYLLGAVSISNSFSRPAKDLLVYYYTKYYGARHKLVKSKRPYTLDETNRKRAASLFRALNAKQAFVVLKEQLGHLGYSVPTLYKQYTDLCNPGGAVFLGFNIDPDFNDCVDGLVVVDINDLTAVKRKRYGLMGHEISHETALPAKALPSNQE